MAFPLAALSLVTLGAAATVGGVSYLRTKKKIKEGETGAFADREDEPVGPKLKSPHAKDAELPGSKAKRQDPPTASKSPVKAAPQPA